MLYIIATPIGNLEDITYRAVRVLGEVDVVLCEDTRVTKKLLSHYKITTPTISVHQHTKDDKILHIVERLVAGEHMALVTDAGTPGVSDPGNQLVAAARAAGVAVVPVPGAAALTALISVAGVDLQTFTFLAYPPHKKGRQTFFDRVVTEVSAHKQPVIYYDSVHRVVKNLQLLAERAQEQGIDVQVIMGRELTKMFEEIKTGSVREIINYLETHPDKVKGEFVIVVY